MDEASRSSSERPAERAWIAGWCWAMLSLASLVPANLFFAFIALPVGPCGEVPAESGTLAARFCASLETLPYVVSLGLLFAPLAALFIGTVIAIAFRSWLGLLAATILPWAALVVVWIKVL